MTGHPRRLDRELSIVLHSKNGRIRGRVGVRQPSGGLLQVAAALPDSGKF